MPRISLTSLLAGILTSVVVGQDPVPEKPAPKTPGTWILQIEGDSAGLRVTGVSHKKFSFRARRRLTSRFRIRLLDAKGKLLSSIPVDLTDFCLDPAHRGKKDHVRGDVIIQHKVVTTIKVPALTDVAEIHIARLVGKNLKVLGKIDRKSVTGLVGKQKEVR